MKKLVYGAAALTLAGSAFASDTDWSAFDQDADVQALATSLADGHEGPTLGGYLQTLYSNNSDMDVSGFDVLLGRIALSGGREGYTYNVSYETTDNSLRDAYFTIPVSSISARFGRFKPGISRNGLMESSNLFFINRSAIGEAFRGRQDGVGLNGDFDQLAWWLSITDGQDGNVDDYLIAGRVALDLIGEGIGSVEGAYGGPDEIGAEAAISFYDDGGVTDGDGILVEAHAVSSVYSFGLEFAALGGDDNTQIAGGTTGVTAIFADSSPFTLYGTYMLTPDQWEVGLRFQDLDDAADTSVIEVGVSHYLDGHNLKWGFGYSTISSDITAAEQDLLQFLLSMRF